MQMIVPDKSVLCISGFAKSCDLPNAKLYVILMVSLKVDCLNLPLEGFIVVDCQIFSQYLSTGRDIISLYMV